jgi:hypothetical protein
MPSRDDLTKKLSSNPRFREAKKPGQGYAIIGARPSSSAKLGYAPWIADPDPPELLTESEIRQLARGFGLLR